MLTAWIRMRPRELGNLSWSKLFDTQTTFSPALSDIETLWKLKQMKNLADSNLFWWVKGEHLNTIWSTSHLHRDKNMGYGSRNLTPAGESDKNQIDMFFKHTDKILVRGRFQDLGLFCLQWTCDHDANKVMGLLFITNISLLRRAFSPWYVYTVNLIWSFVNSSGKTQNIKEPIMLS